MAKRPCIPRVEEITLTLAIYCSTLWIARVTRTRGEHRGRSPWTYRIKRNARRCFLPPKGVFGIWFVFFWTATTSKSIHKMTGAEHHYYSLQRVGATVPC